MYVWIWYVQVILSESSSTRVSHVFFVEVGCDRYDVWTFEVLALICVYFCEKLSIEAQIQEKKH